MFSLTCMEQPSPPILILPLCFIGTAGGIFTAWITRYEYDALNRLFLRRGIEDNGLEYIILFVLGLLAALFFYFWRISKLPIRKALGAICVIVTGGCLGAILAEALTYQALFNLLGYFVGLGVGNAVARKLGM
jgi:hypothetical protein